MKKHTLSALAIFAALAFVVSATIIPLASASELLSKRTSPQIGEVVAVSMQSGQLPSFIPNSAVAMTDAEMSEVRGEVWYVNMITGAIVGMTTMKAIYGDAYYASGCVPWYVPWFLKPITAS